MKVFFDTSSLFKLYQKESGTQELADFFNKNKVDSLYLAEITVIEFSSAVWKKCRKKEIDETLAKILIEKFDKDFDKYSLVPQTFELRSLPKSLIRKYWREGLRALDSIQLASGLLIKSEIEYFFHQIYCYPN